MRLTVFDFVWSVFMKNRIFSLLLAICLTICCTVPVLGQTSLNYTDKAQILYPESVQLLTQLGIISGFPDNSFRPEETITRAQMAKIITSLLLSEEDLATLEVRSGVFIDVDLANGTSAHWAAPYIYWCYEQGILHGDGLIEANQMTTFRPDDPVTGVEAAKMLLIALGYGADEEELVGENWAKHTNSLAKSIGLYTDYLEEYSAPLRRDAACLLSCNALQATPVKSYQTDVNGATMRIMDSQTLLERHFPDATKATPHSSFSDSEMTQVTDSQNSTPIDSQP